MFTNKSAWFSSSVPPACQDFWALQGGTAAGWRAADYLFSAAATCPDTVRIFESKDYLRSRATVFHSLFLSTCETRRSVRSVFIGHYVLPPASVQDEVRNIVGRLIWDREDSEQSLVQSCSCHRDAECNEGEVNKISKSDPEPLFAEASESQSPLCSHMQDYPVSNLLTGYIHMDNLQKYTGDLFDFHPECLRCRNCKPAHTPTCNKRKAC